MGIDGKVGGLVMVMICYWDLCLFFCYIIFILMVVFLMESWEVVW